MSQKHAIKSSENTKAPVRCAIYTHKTNEVGLELEFNSLHAQRATAENYILSQKHEGWVLIPEHYDDGGYSGGTLKRPALQRLFDDIKAGKIDMVLVYKIDRLVRSLRGFVKINDLFQEYNVDFASVTQPINTSTSAGKMFLNILLTFAQFEMEIDGERVSEKFALCRKRGVWLGGNPPFGYDIEKKGLAINKTEAEVVRHIYKRFTQLGSITQLVRELNEQGYKTKTWVSMKKGRLHKGGRFSKNTVRRILTSPLYIGNIHHKGEQFEGKHEAIIDQKTWGQVQGMFNKLGEEQKKGRVTGNSALLKGIIHCSHCQEMMTPTYTKKSNRAYHYYTCRGKIKAYSKDCPITAIPAHQVEKFVTMQIKRILRSPEIVASVWAKVSVGNSGSDNGGKGTKGNGLAERDTIEALKKVDAVWDDLFPLEQQRITHLLVEKVVVAPGGIDVQVRTEGLHSFVAEIKEQAAIVSTIKVKAENKRRAAA